MATDTLSAPLSISRPVLHEQVAQRLRQMLVEGLIPPGGKLNERTLCEELSISRTPLREAIKMLAAEGLVELLPNRGSVAVQLSEADVLHTFEVMAGLEGLSGELAAQRVTEAELNEIKALHYEMLAAFTRRDLSAYIDTSQGVVIPPISPNFKIFSRPQAHRFDAGDPVILVLGRVVPHKRIEQAIELTAMLHKQGCMARLEVVGPCSNDGYRAHLSQIIEAQGLNAHVQMRGMVDEATLQDCYARASVLLSTSEHEGFCVPVLEAMHLGVPVVVRQGTAAIEVGGDAVLAFSTPDEAAAQLYRALNDLGVRDELVKLGYERASALIRQASVDIWIPLLERL